MNESITILQGPLEGQLKEGFDAVAAMLYPPDARSAGVTHASRFLTALLVLRDGRPVARCCLYDHPLLTVDGAPVLQMGNVESLNDEQAFLALVQAAEEQARRLGKTRIIGPMNGSTWDAYRVVVGPQEDRFFSEPAQQPYYTDLFEGSGFDVLHRYVTRRAPATLAGENTGMAGQQQSLPGIAVRALSAETLEADLRRLHPLCLLAFEKAALFTPVSEREFVARYLPFKALLRLGYAWIAEDDTGAPLAFLLGFPDSLSPDRAVLKTVAKHPDCAIKGVMSILVTRFLETARRDGRNTILHAFVHEGNQSSLTRSAAFGSAPFREYRLYAKNLRP